MTAAGPIAHHTAVKQRHGVQRRPPLTPAPGLVTACLGSFFGMPSDYSYIAVGAAINIYVNEVGRLLHSLTFLFVPLRILRHYWFRQMSPHDSPVLVGQSAFFFFFFKQIDLKKFQMEICRNTESYNDERTNEV